MSMCSHSSSLGCAWRKIQWVLSSESGIQEAKVGRNEVLAVAPSSVVSLSVGLAVAGQESPLRWNWPSLVGVAGISLGCVAEVSREGRASRK